MKKLATLVMFLCLGAFTLGPVVGCGGKDEKKEEKKEEKKDETPPAADTTGAES